MKTDFWEEWKKKTPVEKKAIISIIKARKAILKSIPKNKLVAIYIKGSFVRREMNKKSDVDIVPIVTENKYEKPVFSVNKPEIAPCIIVPLSLWELKNNKLFTKSNTPRAKPDRFIKYLDYYKLIYGKPLNTINFKIRKDEESLKDFIKVFKKSLITLYKKGKIGFSIIIKETFWLTDLEQRIKGITPTFSFIGIAQSVKNKNHVIHNALKLRQNKTKNKRIKERFIAKLQTHLKKLEKQTK